MNDNRKAGLVMPFFAPLPPSATADYFSDSIATDMLAISWRHRSPFASTMPTLYTLSGTCALAPNIVIAWLDAPVDVVNLTRGEQKKPAYLQINPQGKVPALQFENGDVLTEVLAILAYLEAMYSTESLSREQVLGRKEAEALSFMSAEVHAAFAPHFSPSSFADSKTARDELKRKTYARLGRHFSQLDETVRANGDGWYLGVRSLADPYLYVLTRWIAQTPISLSNYASLMQHRRRMQADGGVRRALERQAMTLQKD